MMVELVNGGLAIVTTERVVAGMHRIEVARVRITEAGRRALRGAVQGEFNCTKSFGPASC